ncbi:hypothetical protein SAMN06297397_2495 [Aristaeella lactis]|uniref:Uncharacterized protein n=2 Tax=Aristaeella lactis TaxID=3046383 RepID=A0AC61PNS2_9FIRM|nr:hypothetical protein SAMN06297397_2495 [Aristaeella lactis]
MTKCPKCGQLIPSSTAKCPACGNPTGYKIKTKLTIGTIILIVVLFALSLVMRDDLWAGIVFALGILYFIRLRKIQKEEKAAQAEAGIEPDKECRLCGIQVPELVPAVLPSGKTIYVCGECFRANKFHKPGEYENPLEEKPKEEAVAAAVKPEEIPAAEPVRKDAPLITETEAEREARIACLTEKRKSGGFLQEELFLEDIEDENSIKKILELWDSYDLSGDYPGIGACMARLADKDGMFSYATAQRLRKELHDLFA